MNDIPEKDKKKAREEFQNNVISSFLEIATDKDVHDKNYNLFYKYIKQVLTEGSGMKKGEKYLVEV